MDPKKIDRINELAKKKKTEGLTPEEKVEQAKLREEYIEGYRRTVRHHIEGIKIVDEEGNDLTPEKLRQQRRNSKSYPICLQWLEWLQPCSLEVLLQLM